MIRPDNTLDQSEVWLRFVLLMVVVLLAVIITIDMYTMPAKTFPHFNSIRLIGQLLPILAAFVITFIPNFQQIYQSALLILALMFSMVNLYIIWAAWSHSQYAFAYEGLMINVFFFYFITRMRFLSAVIYASIIVTTFMLLIMIYPIYGGRNWFNWVMLFSAHLIALVGVYRLERTQKENQTYNELLITYSITDELTQIYNRKGYQQYADDLFQACLQTQQHMSLLLIDIDHFKQLNDQLGHAKGDEVLQRQAQFLKNIFNEPTDLICRFGGDEFLVITLQSPSKVEHSVIKINQLWSVPIAEDGDTTSPQLSCSIGVCGGTPSPNLTLNDYFLKADQALYQVKKQGRANHFIKPID